MKRAIWIGFLVLMLAWTLFMAGTAEVARWAGGFVSTGGSIDWDGVATAVRVPAWLAQWVGPTWIEAAVGAAVDLLKAADAALPWLGAVAGWLAIALWVLWGVGALALLLLAAGMHALARTMPAA